MTDPIQTESIPNLDMPATMIFRQSILTGENAKTFDFTSIIDLVLPILVDSIKSCLGASASNSQVAATLAANRNTLGMRLKAISAVRSNAQKTGVALSGAGTLALSNSILGAFADKDATANMLTEMDALSTWEIL